MKLVIPILSVFIFMSCQSQKVASATEEATEATEETQTESTDNPLLTGEWVLDYMSPVNGKQTKEIFKLQMPYLNFVDNEKVAGNNGCNNIAGEYSIEGNKIKFETDKFRSTRMFCEGIDESAFPGVLKTINRYTIINNGNKLMLLTGDIVSMTFVKKTE